MKIAVVGGGIVGLAIAEHLLSVGNDVLVLEKESTWAMHQTGHNSGVIHAGPYYKPGSLKAEMCRAGNASMVAFAQNHGIPHEVCGKVIAATSPDELPQLHALTQRARENGVAFEEVSGTQIKDIEPHVSAVAGLHVKETGIIDYGAVATRLAELAHRGGADLRLDTEVRGIVESGVEIIVEHGSGSDSCDFLINAAGLHSDRIAELAGFTTPVRIVPFRGEYYELKPEKRVLVRSLIYPVPDPELPFLGVHFTRMIDGAVHAGPNAVLALKREGYSWGQMSIRDTFATVTYRGFGRLAARNIGTGLSEMFRSFSKSRFSRDLARLIPEITPADIVRAGAGVRAQAILPNGTLSDDFVIERNARQIHVLNAPSPAATSALEIAKYIGKLVN